MNVNLFVIIPLMTTFCIFVIPHKNIRMIKYVSLIGSLLVLAYSLYFLITYYHIAYIFNNGNKYIQLSFQQKNIWFSSLGIYYFVAIDGISMLMIFMTSIVIFTGTLASWSVNERAKEFFVLLFLLVSGVFGVFISFDIFTFFIFYEIAVLPMYLLIGIWGTGKKEYAAMKLTLVLMFSSTLILLSFLAIYNESAVKTFDLSVLAHMNFSTDFQCFIFPCLFVGFGVLGALYPFHTWSPDGHASAPTSVSMLHAGVLMKLGGYGIIRIGVYLLPEGAQEWSLFFMILSTINIVYGSFSAIAQKDLKYFTAYSSVSHCGFVLFGISSLNSISLKGAILQMFSHGIMTALFFSLIGFVYSRTHTRLIYEMEGLAESIPNISICFFIAGLASLGMPGLSGFIAETHVFFGGILGNPWINTSVTIILTISISCSILVTTVYVLRGLCQIFMGRIKNKEFLLINDTKTYEISCLIVLIFILCFVGFMPLFFINLIESSIVPIVNRLYL